MNKRTDTRLKIGLKRVQKAHIKSLKSFKDVIEFAHKNKLLEDDELKLIEMDKETLKRRNIEIFLLNNPWTIEYEKFTIKSSTMESKIKFMDLFSDNYRAYNVQKTNLNSANGGPLAWFYLKLDYPIMVNGVGM